MPKVSVVIPVYNQAKYIGESIRSVLDQTLTDFEIVIVDDGSTDNTREVIESFRDPRIRYFYQENRGVLAAANRSFELSRGEYISFFSSDDDLLETALEKSVAVLDRHPEVAFSHGQTYLMDENGHIFGLSRHHIKHSCIRPGIRIIRDYLVYGNHISSVTAVGRRSCILEAGKFDSAFGYGSEDCDLWLRLARKYGDAYIAEPLTKYRKHTHSVSSGRKVEEIEKTHSLILERIFSDAELVASLSFPRPRAYFCLYLRLSDYSLSLANIKTARMYLWKALKIYPRGLFQSTGLFWISHFIRVWVPRPVLRASLRINYLTYKLVRRIKGK